jgi:NAD(P)-dependent dehydrogenase (short-subunit alcohol dehydrogenase family)
MAADAASEAAAICAEAACAKAGLARPRLATASTSRLSTRVMNFFMVCGDETQRRGGRVSTAPAVAVAAAARIRARPCRMGMNEEQMKGPEAQMASQVPLKRIADPSGIAKAVLFLASSDSSYVVGAELVVDGGLA